MLFKVRPASREATAPSSRGLRPPCREATRRIPGRARIRYAGRVSRADDERHPRLLPRRVPWSARFLPWLAMFLFFIWSSEDLDVGRGVLLAFVCMIPAWLVGRLVEIMMGWFGSEA